MCTCQSISKVSLPRWLVRQGRRLSEKASGGHSVALGSHESKRHHFTWSVIVPPQTAEDYCSSVVSLAWHSAARGELTLDNDFFEGRAHHPNGARLRLSGRGPRLPQPQRADVPLSITRETPFCVETLEDALMRHAKPDIFNADQGSDTCYGTNIIQIFWEGLQFHRRGEGCEVTISFS
jgi:hypothetical protein